MGIKEVIAGNVRAYRKRSGLTQSDLACRSGLSRNYVGSIEQADANLGVVNLAKMAKALGVDPSALLTKGPNERLDDIRNAASSHSGEKGPGMPCVRTYGLCEWSPAGVAVRPIDVHRPSLSIEILGTLVRSGHKEDLPEAYDEIHETVLRLAASAHDNSVRQIVYRVVGFEE